MELYKASIVLSALCLIYGISLIRAQGCTTDSCFTDFTTSFENLQAQLEEGINRMLALDQTGSDAYVTYQQCTGASVSSSSGGPVESTTVRLTTTYKPSGSPYSTSSQSSGSSSFGSGWISPSSSPQGGSTSGSGWVSSSRSPNGGSSSTFGSGWISSSKSPNGGSSSLGSGWISPSPSPKSGSSVSPGAQVTTQPTAHTTSNLPTTVVYSMGPGASSTEPVNGHSTTESTSKNTRMIIGIVLGVGFGCLILFTLMCWCMSRGPQGGVRSLHSLATQKPTGMGHFPPVQERNPYVFENRHFQPGFY